MDKIKKSHLYKKVRTIFLKLKYVLSIALIIILFPLIVDLFYHIPIDFFYIEEDTIINFYGVALGIFSSFITYYFEKKKEKENRNQEIKPHIALNLDKRENVFVITLHNIGSSIIKDVWIYDVYIDSWLNKSKEYEFSFSKEKNKENIFYVNLKDYDKNLIDEDGFPKYICISCCDTDERMWLCEYIKIKNNEQMLYMPKEFHLA